jgi:hypothetical protein
MQEFPNMVMPIIPKSLYPAVPNAPGVPALLRNAATIADTATFGLLGVSDALDLLIGAEQVQWGIFETETGLPVVIADSVLGFDYRNGAKIADFPVEDGTFATYNKTATPFDIKVRMVCGGDDERRRSFIEAIEAASRSLTLYDVVTPQAAYANANIEAWDYRRDTSGGAGIIVADLYLREVREATAAYSVAPVPKSPSAASTVDMGRVQPVKPPESILSTLKSKLGL